jgi:hypothetical protein
MKISSRYAMTASTRNASAAAKISTAVRLMPPLDDVLACRPAAVAALVARAGVPGGVGVGASTGRPVAERNAAGNPYRSKPYVSWNAESKLSPPFNSAKNEANFSGPLSMRYFTIAYDCP